MENLPQRKKIRLQGYDYSQNGAYFITICTYNRKMIFGIIKNGVMQLNKKGLIAKTHIKKLNSLYDGIIVSKYVIMPNHIHMIVEISRQNFTSSEKGNVTKAQLPKIVQIFKASVTKTIHTSGEKRNAYNAFPTVWQSHFNDHIIRNEQEYKSIWEYIDTNPIKWEEDCFYEV